MASASRFASSGIVEEDAATRKAREVAAMLSKTLRSSIPLKPLSSMNTMLVPNDKVGLIIGKGGAQIKEIESVAGVKLQLDTSGLGEPSRKIWITGTDKGVALAKTKIQELLESSKLGGRASQNPAKIIPIPCDKVGLLIGTGGSTIRRLSQETSCHLKVVNSEEALRTGQQVPDEGFQNLHIMGRIDAAARAEIAVKELLSTETNNRTALTAMAGYGAYQQQIYQQRAQPYTVYSPQNYDAIIQAYFNSSQSCISANYAYAQQGQIYPPQVYDTRASVGFHQYPPPSHYTTSISTANAGLMDNSTKQSAPSNIATQQSASSVGNMSPMPGQQQVIHQAVPEYIHSVDNQRILTGSEKTTPQ